MNDFNKYLDDPDLINWPESLREIHAIRLMIQAETSGMTIEQGLNITGTPERKTPANMG